MVSQNTNNTLSTVHRAFDIVEILRKQRGARVTEIAEEMNVAPSTVHKYLATLIDEGLVVKEGDEYHVGAKFIDLGAYVKKRKRGYALCIEKVSVLAEETGERAQFLIEEHGKGIYVATETVDESAVQMDRHPGMSRPLHMTSDGKAILAHLPPHRVDQIVEKHGLPSETENTITDKEELMKELARIRETGIAFNDEESVVGLRAVGVPVNAPNGLVLGALSVSGPSNRLKGDVYKEEIPNLLLGHANEIELKLRYA